MPSFKEAVRKAELMLEAESKSMQLAKLFMLEICDLAKINLYMQYEEAIDEALYATYTKGIERLLKDEPMQYILGYEWFYGRKFLVNGDVLIPRPETEELVSYVLAKIDDKYATMQGISLADVGCGSGAIGLSLKLEEPTLQVILSDISDKALAVAQKNAELLGAKADFMLGSMLDPLVEAKIKVDVIVCNPPYIPCDEVLANSVKDYEPNIALFGGNDGLKFYKMVFDKCEAVLNPHGFMAFEIGYDQKDALLSEAHKRFPQAKSEVIQDMYGKDRMLFIDFM